MKKNNRKVSRNYKLKMDRLMKTIRKKRGMYDHSMGNEKVTPYHEIVNLIDIPEYNDIDIRTLTVAMEILEHQMYAYVLGYEKYLPGKSGEK